MRKRRAKNMNLGYREQYGIVRETDNGKDQLSNTEVSRNSISDALISGDEYCEAKNPRDMLTLNDLRRSYHELFHDRRLSSILVCHRHSLNLCSSFAGELRLHRTGRYVVRE